MHLLLIIISVTAAGVIADHKADDKNEAGKIPETDQLVLSPLTAYAYLGSIVNITCTRMDDFDVDQIYFKSTIKFNVSSAPEHSINRTLTALISNISYNGTEIRCTGRNATDGTLYESVDTTTIRIQGYLASVKVHAAMTQTEHSCKLKIHWAPPFTLPVPGVPILGYNVNITNTVTNETQKMFVNETRVHIPIGYYTVSVAGVNPVGEGNISTIHVDPTQFSTEFNISPENVTVSRKGKSDWTIQVIVDNHIFCQQNDDISMNVIDKVNTSNSFTTRDVILNDNGDNTTVLTGTLSLLPEDRHYWVNVNINTGNYTRVSDNQSLSTFDVIDVEVVRSQHTCFKITYVNGRLANGCRIKIYCQTYSFEESIFGNTNCQESKFLLLLSSFTPKDYFVNCTIKAYDIVKDDIRDQNDPAVVLTNVTFFISSTSSLPTPSPTRSSSSSTPSQSVEPTIDGFTIGFISAFAAVTAILIIVIIIGAIIVTCNCLYKRRKNMPDDQDVDE